MVQKLAANPRKGYVAESLGTVLLQGLSTVAPIPGISEDVGIDLVATLLRQQKSTLYAEDSFTVQIKSKSIREIEYTGEQVDWLLSLELPFFIGSVDLEAARIDLYACHRLAQAAIENAEYKTVVLDLESRDEAKDGPEDGRKLCVGPPVLSWTVNDMSDKDFVRNAYKVLKPHLQTYRRNLEFCRCGRCEILAWKTGDVPKLSDVRMRSGEFSEGVQSAMNLAMPYISACLLEFNGTGQLDAYDALREAVEQMQEIGADRDPLIEAIDGMRQKKTS